jgi:hypothetical protein
VDKIILGQHYRNKQSPMYYARAMRILKPFQDENTNPFIVVKCEWMTHPDSVIGLIKYFRPRDLSPITPIKI